jgi:hypothetical protein
LNAAGRGQVAPEYSFKVDPGLLSAIRIVVCQLFQDAPDDHERTQGADGQIDSADNPIKERHIFMPPPLRPRERKHRRFVATMNGEQATSGFLFPIHRKDH